MVVSEYIDNGTLYDLIGDSDRRHSIFSWEKRLSLCIGIARGISYLHHDIHPRVIHRDIKPANILLDANLAPKITDFDLVDFIYQDQDFPLEDEVVGTYGYADPEYIETGEYTEKADVYAFGVVMLEVVSGRRVLELQLNDIKKVDTLRWAGRLVAGGRKLKIVDPLLTDFPKGDALRFIDVALLCIQRPSERRPSMSDVLLMLYEVCHPRGKALRGVHLCSNIDPTIIQAHLFAQARGGQDRTQEQSNGATISQTRLFPGNTTTTTTNNNNNVCLESVYPPFRTRVFTRNTTTITTTSNNNSNVFPEAVYPPFLTRVFQRLGSRNLHACEPRRAQSQDDISARDSQTAVFMNCSRNVFPEAVYPPFQTGTFRRHGSRNLYTFSTMHSVS